MIARLIAKPFEFGKQGLSDTRACDWWRARRVALNRNQWSSVAIRGKSIPLAQLATLIRRSSASVPSAAPLHGALARCTATVPHT